ncbi:heparinase II/III domain-containing protein [Roseivirga sp.]|uniref:heparinase II/III domain-containing protein n=1 Tax=Roseivirga sp. TaxID=1964215 RepID=UPI003B8E8624
MSLFFKYWHTLKHLKLVQIRYRLYYVLKRCFLGRFQPKVVDHPSVISLKYSCPIQHNNSYLKQKGFIFLNVKHEFEGEIDWNFKGHGKLWTYNLNYFDFLHQAAFSPENGVQLMSAFADQYNQLIDGKESYPTSLRIMNWVAFIAKYNVKEDKLNQVIFYDLCRLSKNIEYHLLGNHLMENAFGLLFGSIFFQNADIYQKASAILTIQLEEQVLDDGAHFELSPMYHQIILSRLLSSIDLLKHNDVFEAKDLMELMITKAKLMLGWLAAIGFKNGTLPAVNDSTEGIAPSSTALFDYAQKLGVVWDEAPLGASGYRKRSTPLFELFVDFGNIGPDYIPGHAHSDTLNFLLNIRDQAVIVDTGISTYEKNSKRSAQRRTSAHNTVMVNNMEQTDVWGGFRVGRRAKATIIADEPSRLIASHNGYENWGITHERSFEISDDTIVIKDSLTRPAEAKAFFHFEPSIEINLEGQKIIGEFGSILFENAAAINIESYDLALGFNMTRKAKVAVITFSIKLTTHIHIS